MKQINQDTYKRYKVSNIANSVCAYNDLNAYIQRETKSSKSYRGKIDNVLKKAVHALGYHCLGVWSNKKTITFFFEPKEKAMGLYINIHKGLWHIIDEENGRIYNDSE